MAKRSITTEFTNEDAGIETSLRPQYLREYIGQEKVKSNLKVYIEAAKERGAGETLACGTGTCAAVVACVLNGKTDENVTVHLLGGDLYIVYDREAETVFMTGPATVVFDGEIDITDIDV